MGLRDETWSWIQPGLQELKSTADQPWDERKSKLLEQLGLGSEDDHVVVRELVRELDEMSEDDRNQTLDSDQVQTMAYGLVQTLVTEPATEQAADGASAGYDEQAWQAFLTTNGPSWDGTAESWTQFRQWFEYHATDQQVGAPATALLDHMEGQAPADRVNTFAQYGVTIAASATTTAAPTTGAQTDGEFGWVSSEQAGALAGIFGQSWQEPLSADLTTRWGAGWQSHPAEHKAAWLGDLISTGQLGGTKSTGATEPAAVSDEEIAADLTELIDSIPGVEIMSDEEIAKALTELLDNA